QAQLLNLFERLRRDFGLAYLFISHDLGVVRHLCDRIAVMYLGKLVEIGSSDSVYRQPRHPYTAALLGAVPGVARARKGPRHPRVKLEGELPARRSALRERGAAPAGRRIGSRCRLPLSPRRGRAGDDGGQARSAGTDRLMISFVLRRVVQLVPVLLGVTLLAFLLVNLLPGNMALAILGPDASQEAIAHLQQQLGLNQ